MTTGTPFKVITILYIAAILAAPTDVLAEPLSQEALYNRCYTHLTTQPAPKDSRYTEVVNGTKTAAQACTELLDKATLVSNGNTTILDQNDIEAQNVLRTFSSFHGTWLLNRTIPPANTCLDAQTSDVFNPNSTAFSITRSLFNRSVDYSAVLTSSTLYNTIRTNGLDPETGPITRNSKDIYFNINLQPMPELIFASSGTIVGFENERSLTVAEMGVFPPNGSRVGVGPGRDVYSPINGGGVLSSPTYLTVNVAEETTFRADGALNMTRSWSKAVLKDFLCRDIPVIRYSDAKLFVVDNPTDGTPEFRRTQGCVQCHATLDRMASTIRNYRMGSIGACAGNRGVPPKSAFTPAPYDQNPAFGKEAKWPTEPDPSYHLRPTNGVFYYRSTDGTLTNTEVTGISDLAQKITAQDDYYHCAAKRYYKYFTGVDVTLVDIKDPALNRTIASDDQKHWDRVMSLGESLKGHQDLYLLIQEIIGSDYYGAKVLGE